MPGSKAARSSGTTMSMASSRPTYGSSTAAQLAPAPYDVGVSPHRRDGHRGAVGELEVSRRRGVLDERVLPGRLQVDGVGQGQAPRFRDVAGLRIDGTRSSVCSSTQPLISRRAASGSAR